MLLYDSFCCACEFSYSFIFFLEGYGVLLYVDLFGIENGFVPRTPFFLGNPILCSSCEHCAPSGALTLANLFHMKRLQAYDILT